MMVFRYRMTSAEMWVRSVARACTRHTCEERSLWHHDAPRRCGGGLEVLQGRIIGPCYERHRHQEFLRFLRRLDQECPGDVPFHLVMDNYGTHKHPSVQAWLTRHPRVIPHVVPTSFS
jgi:hypothetical protein